MCPEPGCDFIAKYKSRLKRHFKLAHQNKKRRMIYDETDYPRECRCCGDKSKTYVSKKGFEIHLMKQHSSTELAEAEYNLESHLWRHDLKAKL